MSSEERREGFVEKHIFNLAQVSIYLFGVILYPSLWFLWRVLTGHELPGKPIFSVQNLVATPVTLFAAGLAWHLYQRKSLQFGVDSRAYAIRTRALRRLESGWINLYFEPSIEGKQPICLPLRFAPSAVEHPGIEEAMAVLKDSDQELPAGTTVHQVFEQSEGSLLVLGQPGSGKTTLLLQLAKHLHGLAKEDPSQPIPIFLRLANWNRWWGIRSGKHAFEHWLIRQMKQSYFIDKDLGREWLRTGKVILLLDGLDEIANAKAQRSCHCAIRSLFPSLRGGLAVSSRIEEYERFERLPMDFAVEALPATKAQVLEYISAIPSAHKLNMALRDDSDAVALLTTPFALTLALATYAGKSKLRPPRDGLFSIFRLLHDFVQAEFSIHLKTGRYKKEAFLRWMGNLAQCSVLGKQTVFDPVELRERWFSNIWMHITCKCIVVLAILAFCFAIEWMLWSIRYIATSACRSASSSAPCVSLAFKTGNFWFAWKPIPSDLVWAAIQGIIATCVIGVPVGIFGSLFQLRPVQLAPAGFFSSRLRQSLRVFVAAAVGISVILVPVGLILRQFFRQQLMPYSWSWATNPLLQLRGPLYAQVGYAIGATLTLKTSALFGLCIGILLALTTFLSSETNSNRTLTHAVRTSVLIALSFGAVTGTVLWFFMPPMWIENVTGIGVGLLDKEDFPFGGALLILLAAGGLFTIRHYVTRLMMVLMRCGPWNYSKFLDLATECGFLRRVSGSDRIFRHPTIRDYFANFSQKEGS